MQADTEGRERESTVERAEATVVDAVSSRPLVLGLEGGLVATAVMTAFRMPISHSLPPTGAFWATFVGSGGPDDHPVPALVLHAAYGALAGAVFAAAFVPRVRGSDADRELAGALWGSIYGLALSAFGLRVVLGRLLGMELDRDERLVFHAGHVVYGLTLGTWLGSNVEPDE